MTLNLCFQLRLNINLQTLFTFVLLRTSKMKNKVNLIFNTEQWYAHQVENPII